LKDDIYLRRWCNILAAMAIFTALVTSIAIFAPLFVDAPIGLVKNGGAQSWVTVFSGLPLVDRLTILFIHSFEPAVWLYAVLQIFRLARNYRGGQIFGEANARCFIRIGAALGLMGILHFVTYPAINYFLFWRGISPWLGDMPGLFLFRIDYLMAGVLFFVLGKIMRRASELEETDRLMI
jgi:hypothetical protein